MTKKEILDNANDPKIYNTQIYTQFEAEWAMEEYAKVVLGFLLERNNSDYEGERIVMTGGDFYWFRDEDGDQPLNAEQIIKLYENNKK